MTSTKQTLLRRLYRLTLEQGELLKKLERLHKEKEALELQFWRKK
jgi:hypothetical protein